MNNILIIFEMIITLIFIFILYKKYHHEGLYLYSVLAYTLAIIISVKNIEILSLEIPLGIILTTSIYIASNILVQDKGLESIKKLLKILLITSISTISVVLLTSSLIPNDNNLINNTYSLMFINKIRIIISTAIVPFIVLWLNTNIYYQLKREKNNIIISNLLSMLIIYFIDATLLGLLAFIFIIPINEIYVTIAIIYVIKMILGLLSIPLIYILRKIKD